MLGPKRYPPVDMPWLVRAANKVVSVLQVEKTMDTWEGKGGDSESDSMKLRPLIGTVTSFSGDSGLINQTTFFPRQSLWEGTGTNSC